MDDDKSDKRRTGNFHVRINANLPKNHTMTDILNKVDKKVDITKEVIEFEKNRESNLTQEKKPELNIKNNTEATQVKTDASTTQALITNTNINPKKERSKFKPIPIAAAIFSALTIITGGALFFVMEEIPKWISIPTLALGAIAEIVSMVFVLKDCQEPKNDAKLTEL